VRIINAHVHIGPSIALSMNVKPEDVRREMIEAGISHCLVFPFPSWAVETPDVNSWIFDVCRNESSFIPVFYVRNDLEPPLKRDYVAVKWHWVCGVSDARSNYTILEQPEIDEFARVVAELEIPVIFEEEFEFTRIFAEKFPDVILIIPHLGSLGGDPLEFLNQFENRDNVYFDTSLSSLSTLERFIDDIGCERIIFGSDLPFGRMNTELSTVMKLEIDEKDRKKILCKNAEKLFNI